MHKKAKDRKKELVTVPGLDRGLKILEFLSSSERGKTQMEIAIWITGPSENITAADIPKIGADFKSAALRISSILGFDATVPRE